MLAYIRIGFIVGLWTLSTVLMVVRSVDYENSSLSPLTGWAILTALWATVLTGWQIQACERQRVGDIASLAVAAYLDHEDVSQLH